MSDEEWRRSLEDILTHLRFELLAYDEIKKIRATNPGNYYYYGFTCGLQTATENTVRVLFELLHPRPNLDNNLD